MPAREELAGVVIAAGPLTSYPRSAIAGAYVRPLAPSGRSLRLPVLRESEGRPRQFENPKANIEDIKYRAPRSSLISRRRAQTGAGAPAARAPPVLAVEVPGNEVPAASERDELTGFCEPFLRLAVACRVVEADAASVPAGRAAATSRSGDTVGGQRGWQRGCAGQGADSAKFRRQQ
jgi:hypothetical protein